MPKDKTIYDLPDMAVKSCKKSILARLRDAILIETNPDIREGLAQAMWIVRKKY